MTTTIVFAETSDGFLVSTSTSYATALSGGSFTTNTGASNLSVGQNKVGSEFDVSQSFIDFDGSSVASDLLAVTGYVRLSNRTTFGSGVTRNLEMWEFDWGSSLTSGDWRTPAQISALTQENFIDDANNAGSNQYMRGGLLTGVNPGNSYILVSQRNRNQNTPTGAEYNDIDSANASGTSSDPALYYTTVPLSNLCGILGAQVQLSDGTHAFLELSAPDDSPFNIKLRHHDGTSASDIATIQVVDPGGGTTSFRHPELLGSQAMTLVADDDDNLYVLGVVANLGNTLAARAFIKGAGHSWTPGTFRSATMPDYDEDINNIAAAWHDQGTGGTIVAIVSHGAGRNRFTDIAYALINCNFLLTGSGSLLRASGDAAPILTFFSESNGFNNFLNETGAMLDVVAAPDTTNRGFVVSVNRKVELGGTKDFIQARYQLASGGASFADVNSVDIGPPQVTKDANAKLRVIGISTSQFVSVSADPTSDEGITVYHLQNIGTSGTFTILARVQLSDESISTMPAASTLATANNWDAVYDPNANKVTIYYFDTADGLRLMKTGVDLNTGQADQTEIEVDDAVGAAGSTNHAIRVHRGEMTGDQVLISVANETSGGTHSTIYVLDSLNVAPTAPTLTPEPNFDAITQQILEWTFNDPNAGDTQSAYQLQINTSAGASAIDTGKVASGTSNYTLAASALTNPGDWQWRVKTWDAADEEGPYSDFGTFSTSASGTVTIIDPASDNPAGVNTDSYTVEWTVAGATQDDYRVQVFRTDTEAELLDTDWVNSSDTTFEVTGMLSDVEYRVEVTVRDSGDVETNTDTALITPDYDSPPAPTVNITVNSDDGYILVTVGNPTPEGDEPNADHNDILRRVFSETEDTSYLKIGECEENGSFRDYTAASGVTYEYVARAQSDPSS